MQAKNISGLKIPMPALRESRLAVIGLAATFWLMACSSDNSPATADAARDARGSGPDAPFDAATTADATVADARDASTSDSTSDVPVGLDSGRADVPADGLAIPDTTALDVGADVASPDSASPNPDTAMVDVAAIDTPVGEVAPVDAVAAEAGPDTQSAFTCSSLGAVASGVLQRLCFDFSTASQATSFLPEAGTWSAAAGSYLGTGPAGGQVTCPGGMEGGSQMTTSVLSTLSATDVRVHARMTSLTRPDKVLVLRALPSGDRIELDFRSYFMAGDNRYGGDFVVSMLTACNQVFFVLPDAIPLPQYDNVPIAVDVQLVGARLTVSVDGRPIYDGSPMATGIDGGTPPLPSRAGSVGFGVFQDGEVAFDDLVVEVLK